MNISAEVQDDGSVNLTGKQGSTWILTLSLKQSNGEPMDLTGYTAQAQIRKDYSSVSITAEFTCTVELPESEGNITMRLEAINTASIMAGLESTDDQSTYVYDLEISDNDNPPIISRILEGKLFIDPEVTKD